MLFDGNRFSHRLTACLLIYALVVLDFVPFARALNDMDVRNLEFARRNYSNVEDTPTDHKNTVQANLELESLEGAFSPVSPIANAPGGGQVESSGFSIGSSDGLVDKFTGDFTYSLPLMDVEGYPITLSYNSNVTMMEEASWVGLGWNLNVGSVSREMRGIPDEFNGEQVVTRTLNIQDESNIGNKFGGYAGVGFMADNTFFPVAQLTLLKGGYNSNYLGKGKTFDIGLQGKYSFGDEFYLTPTISLGYSFDSKNGSTISTSLDLNFSQEIGENGQVGLGFSNSKSFSSRAGITSLSTGLNISGGSENDRSGAQGGYAATTALNYGSNTIVPGSNFYSDVTGNQLSTTAFLRGFGFLGAVAEAGLIYQRNNISHTINLGTNYIYSPAIGYFHSGKRDNFVTQDRIKPIMDFNKSELQEYSEEMTDLNFSMQTYDIFRISASGMGGTFRGRRTDFGTYFDASNNSDVKIKSRDVSAGYQPVPPPGKIFVGYAEGDNSGGSASGAFTIGGGHPIDFNPESNKDDFDQSIYFKLSGEATSEDLSAYNLLGGKEAKFFNVVSQNDAIQLTTNLKGDYPPSSSNINASVLNQQIDEIVAATYINPVIAIDRMKHPNPMISITDLNEFPASPPVDSIRNSGYRKDNHISEIESIATNGMRYHFGIPAYTISESNVVFAAENLTVNPSNGLVSYGSSDNSVSNVRGRSHYYEKTTIPAYAHSFLLTEILSPDYIDRSGNGPSIDDIGSYYKFNYSRAYGGGVPYKWRFPVAGGLGGKEAIHNEGLLGTELDDMGTYSYSEKEIWYTHSIETKNLIAEFHLKPRKDAYSVNDENGVLNTDKPLYALDSIVLYSIADRDANGSAAIPLQTVVFEYDYSLCKNSPANLHSYSPNIDTTQSGKLTLLSIRIFGGKSSESGLRSYDFTYSSGPENPPFNYAAVDGWGNYKPNSGLKPNSIFPYAIQDLDLAEQNVQAWKLRSIESPAGGRIDIEYEPDSYSFVQDKRAMRHFEITGLTNIIRLLKSQHEESFDPGFLVNNMESNISSLISSEGGSNNLTNDKTTVQYSQQFGVFDKNHFPNNVIVFELEDEIPGGIAYLDACLEVEKKYFTETSENGSKLMTDLFVKALYNVKSGVQEYMPIFLEISQNYSHALNGKLNYHDGFRGIGVMPIASGSSNYEYGYVVVNPASNKKWRSGNKKYAKNPIQIAAVQYSRQNLPDRIYGSCATCVPDNSIDGQVLLGKEIDFVMVDLNYASSLDLSRSTLRVYEPDNEKYGGNSRVNQITYRDNWNAISGEYESSYSWTYSYPGRSEQSGVSTNEPRSMKDESPLYYWNSYENVVQEFPNETKYSITPETGLLYPEAIVGYGETAVHFNGSRYRGYSVSQFYTAKDYPVIMDKTILNKQARVDKKQIVIGKSVDLFGLTQGFSIITNEWHGATKSTKLLDASNNLLSQSTYTYASWDEQFKMIERDGTINNRHKGIEYDIHGYSNFSSERSKSLMIGLMLKFNIILPIPIPSPIFSISSRERGFYSYVLNKHLNYTPQVKSIQTINMQSVNEAENLAYDYHTGDVLVSSLKDEFDDKLYSVSAPGHWYYEPFKEVSGVNGFSCSGTISSSVLTVAPANKPKFNVGDKLFVHNGGYIYSVWISEIDGSGNFVLIGNTGALFTYLSGSMTAIIAKSLRQNRLSEKIQQAVTKRSPDITGAQFEFPDTTVISSSAITFGERNSYICGNATEGADNDVTPGSTFNPFLYGTKGNLVPDGQYSWQSERIQADHEHGIRFDGTYSEFAPFYQVNTSDDSWYRINESSHPDYNGGDLYQKWRKGGEIAWFDEFGKPIESKDQIGVHSAVLYSYNNEAKLLPIAQAVNAKLQDIAFDGFEDYDLNLPTLNADQTHFDFKDAIGSHVAVSSEIRHSGRTSLKVDPGYLASVSKLVGTLCDEKSTLTSDETFTVDSCFCIPPFQPTPGDYILSVWVKVDTTANVLDYSDAEVEVDITGTGSANYLFTADGPILDGWQRLEGEFTIPSNAAGITVKLKNESGTQDVYFDDLRIHPFLAGMTTNVYHPQTLLPIASHDGYNFTTFYNYDENLNQVRVRVETSEGIKTIVETETGGKKNYSPQ